MSRLIIALFACLNLSAATYYIDYASGNDSNNGTSTGTPWQNHPYSRAFTGSYSHAAGDRFIFKGGVTWPNIHFQMRILRGGTSGSPDYYGVDTSWYTGGSWTRPIWDLQDAKVTNSSGQVDFTRGAAVLVDGYDNGPTQIQYITFDSIEVKRFRAASGANGFGSSCFTQRGWVNRLTYTNIYAHSWTITSVASGNDGGNSGVIHQADALTDISGTVIRNCEFTQEPIVQRSGVAVKGQFTLFRNSIHHVSNAFIGASGPLISNVVYTIQGASDPAAHENSLYLMTPGVVAYNLVFDISTDASAIYLSPSFQHASSGQALAYNNVVYDVGNQGPIEIDSEAGDAYGLLVGASIYNNTLEHGNSTCIRFSNRAKLGYLNIRNNHCITTGTAISYNQAFLGSPATVSHNLTMSQATATSQGYVVGNNYAVTAGGSTINAGIGLSGFTTDFLNNTRVVPWDIGAYEFVGSTPPPFGTVVFRVNRTTATHMLP